MKTTAYYLLIILFAFSAIACSKPRVETEPKRPKHPNELPETGVFYLRYLIERYYVPTSYKVEYDRDGELDVMGVYLNGDRDKYISEETGAEFYRIAEQFGEYGKNTFAFVMPGLYKPYNVLAVNAYQTKEGKKVDVSDRFCICYTDFSIVVKSNYQKQPMEISKKISELTPEDVKWIDWYIAVFPKMEDKRNLTLELTIKDATPLVIKLTGE